MSSSTPGGGATAAMPLQPPTTLTLTAPEAPAAVIATQAPACLILSPLLTNRPQGGAR